MFVPPRSPNLGEANLKSFIQRRGESSPHQPGYHGIYCWLVSYNNRTWCISWVFLACEVNFSMIYYFKWYMLLWSLVAMGLVTSPPTRCYLECFGAKFFGWASHKSSHPFCLSLSLSLSPLRQQPCLKAQTTEQCPSQVQGGRITRITMSSPTGTEQPHKRTFTTCSISAPTFW
jgi:hypothetical protein